MSSTQPTPYALSNFGKSFQGVMAMTALLEGTDTSIEDVRTHWASLRSQLEKLLCLQTSQHGARSFISAEFTGMSTAEEHGIPTEAAPTWDRMRVLQGLHMHLQMWLMVGTHLTATSPSNASMYDASADAMIAVISDCLESSDSLPDAMEAWAEKVITTATESDA